MLLFEAGCQPKSKKNMELWVGCVAGALSDYEYVVKLAKAGFDKIDIEPTRIYSIEDARAFFSARGVHLDALAKTVEDKFISAFVRAINLQWPDVRPAAPDVKSVCLAVAGRQVLTTLSLYARKPR